MFSTHTTKNLSTSTTFTGKRPSASHENESVRTFSDDPFRARFGHRLPRGLRQEARGMQWHNFMACYSPTHGPVQIRNFNFSRGRLGRMNFIADFELRGDDGSVRSFSREITAMGRSLLQRTCWPMPATASRLWSSTSSKSSKLRLPSSTLPITTTMFGPVGFGQTPEASVLSAMVSAANRLHG